MSNVTVVLKGVRFNWLNVLEPQKKYGRYRAEAIIEPGSAADKALEAAILESAIEKWGEKKAPNFVKSAAADKKVCRQLGDNMKPDKNTGEVPDHYVGKVVLSAGRVDERDGPPKTYCARVGQPNKLVRVTKDSDLSDLVKPVAGSYGDMIVDVWAFEYNGAPQVNCTLQSIFFREQGEPIRARRDLSADEVAEELGVEIEDDITFE